MIEKREKRKFIHQHYHYHYHRHTNNRKKWKTSTSNPTSFSVSSYISDKFVKNVYEEIIKKNNLNNKNESNNQEMNLIKTILFVGKQVNNFINFFFVNKKKKKFVDLQHLLKTQKEYTKEYIIKQNNDLVCEQCGNTELIYNQKLCSSCFWLISHLKDKQHQFLSLYQNLCKFVDCKED